MLKKISQITLAICLCFSMAVSSFAVELPSGFYEMRENDMCLTKLDTLSLNDVNRRLVENFIKSPIKFIVCRTYNNSNMITVVYPCDDNGNYIDNDNLNIKLDYTSTSKQAFKIYSANNEFKMCEVRFIKNDRNNELFMPMTTQVNLTDYVVPYFNNFGATSSPKYYIIPCCLDKLQTDIDISNYIVTQDNCENVLIEDNGGLFNKPEPSEPDIPKPPVIVPPLPTIPQGDKYACYDTSIWKSFLLRVFDYIGTSTNVGLRVFSYLIGIWVVITVIKKFLK